MLLPLPLALLSPRALGWASGGEGGGKEIVLLRGAVSKLSAPVTSRAEAHETALGRTGGNRKYCVTSLRTLFCSPSLSPEGISGILVLTPLVVFRKCVIVSSPRCDIKGKGADSQVTTWKVKMRVFPINHSTRRESSTAHS